ncbi:hypothetical protein [Catenulispora sp. MAP12-49]|uniref:hypothetical protein n=1 Tax=Catenulispora sp. MAP12-49 TaxID=3156302 RepID=UPI0035152FFA
MYRYTAAQADFGAARSGRADRVNSVVLSAWEHGRPLHVMEYITWGAPLRYVDAFILDDVVDEVAPSGGRTTDFVLKPVNAATHSPDQWRCIGDHLKVRLVTVERHTLLTEPAGVAMDELGLRPEALLEKLFSRFVIKQGFPVWRFEIRHTADCSPLYTDVWIGGLNLLVEAKSSASRDSVRMALGQLLDYTRFLDKPAQAILVPSRPEGDVLELARSQGTPVIWPASDGTWMSTGRWLSRLGIVSVS